MNGDDDDLEWTRREGRDVVDETNDAGMMPMMRGVIHGYGHGIMGLDGCARFRRRDVDEPVRRREACLLSLICPPSHSWVWARYDRIFQPCPRHRVS